MLHLDAGVHLHEVVVRAIDDALESGYGIQPHRLAKAGGLVLHFQQDVEIGLQGFRRLPLPGRAASGDFTAQGFLGDGRLHQLLLMHLRRAIAQPQRDAPIAIAKHLHFLVAVGVHVELDEDVLVGARLRGLHFRPDFPCADGGVFRGRGNAFGQIFPGIRRRGRQHPLPLAATAADGLQAQAPVWIARQQLGHLAAHGGKDVVRFHEVHAALVGGV